MVSNPKMTLTVFHELYIMDVAENTFSGEGKKKKEKKKRRQDRRDKKEENDE